MNWPIDTERGCPSRILLVEDDSDLSTLLTRMLQTLGHPTVCRENGVRALQTVEEQDFDVVVSDLRMPQMDGLELCTRIRGAYPDVCLILVTAFGNLDSAKRAMQLRIDDFLLKPIEII